MSEVPEVVGRFLSAWTLRDPQIAAAAVTKDVVITDPNGTFTGPAALVEHLDVILRRFDFGITFGTCLVDGDQVACTYRCDMTGRSSRLAGVVTGFDAALFVELREGKIHRWTEYWDPAGVARHLAAAAAPAPAPAPE